MPRENNPTFLLKARKLPAKSADLFLSQATLPDLSLPLAKPSFTTIPLPEFHCESVAEEAAGSAVGKGGEWRAQDQRRLYQLHNQLGNKWSQMAKSFPGNDNCVKNHFFSRLRMSLRHLNKQLPASSPARPAKMHVIYKIVSTCEERFNPHSEYTPAFISFAYQLKNNILDFLGEQRPTLPSVQQTLEDVHLFNKQFKMRDEVLRVPKVARGKPARERQSQEEERAESMLDEPSPAWMQSGVFDACKGQEWSSLQTILQESSRLSQLLHSEPERLEIRMIETSEYLFNDDNLSVNDWLDPISDAPFPPACF